ncbi:MAG: hypothetical protein VXX99_02220 [Bacteroidota bacterium]|nr:hypothetical protein [Bacteroidota bacterium]
MKKLIFLFLIGSSLSIRSQLLELDYRSPVKSESRFSIGFFKQTLLGANTLGHIDTTVEVMNIKFNALGGFLAGFSVAGTQTFWSGNKDDKRNNLSFLLNPTGRINGGFYFIIPLQEKEKSNLKLCLRIGLKLIQGTPLRGFQSSFLSNQAEGGVIYQKLLYENAPENERVDFWVYPQLLFNQINKEDLTVFFDNQIKPVSVGYGLQTGVEFNQRLRLIFLLNQFVNTLFPDTLGIPVLRFTLVYRR